MTRDDLIAFEKEVARRYENGEIHAPIHLSGGNEDQLIEIFKNISPDDWKLCTWRSHYAALLSGIPPDELMRQILAGKSMSINSIEHRFYSSAIAGGILPIAVGLGMGIKRKSEDRKVCCFIGDATSLTGIFHESVRYAWNFNLPVTFVVEDNGLSVKTDVRKVYGISENRSWRAPEDFLPNVIWYKYKMTQEHHGTGQWIPF